ncbi:MAG: carboxylating nicotinate-nucleotide diphosphorylase [Actinomycetes bacterium]
MNPIPTLAPGQVAEIVERALREDLGNGDVTTRSSVPDDSRARAVITQKQPGVIFGLDCAKQAFERLDREARFERRCSEGLERDGGEVAVIEGSARALLAAERTALNLLGRLSGVATVAHRYVKAVEGTGARILDTRKTTPGLRLFEKAAVAAGGGTNHRVGLFDAFLLKENHIAMAGGIERAVALCREADPGLLLEVEVRNLTELVEAIESGADRIMLDNMDLGQMRTAVGITAGRAELEASGGVSLESVRAIAETGVDFISVGAITHSAPTLDLSLLLEPLG